MTETFCTYSKDRDELLVGYLYQDIEPAERQRFEAHLATCPRCRAEVSALTEVRTELARWSPPEHVPLARVSPESAAVSSVGPQLPRPGRRAASGSGGWWALPVWAQVAAAMVFMGIGAGVANLDVRYDTNGLSVRTGWGRGSRDSEGSRGSQGSQGSQAARGAVAAQSAQAGAVGQPAGVTPADLTALEAKMRAELRAAQVARTASAAPDPELLRRVGAMVSESEKRQQRELALRVADVMRDLDTQRRADLVKIDRSLGLIQDNAGVEVLKQRELLNYLVRASQNK